MYAMASSGVQEDPHSPSYHGAKGLLVARHIVNTESTVY